MSSAESTTERGKVALITGITGQDGSYLAELLLSKVIAYDSIDGRVMKCTVLSDVLRPLIRGELIICTRIPIIRVFVFSCIMETSPIPPICVD